MDALVKSIIDSESIAERVLQERDCIYTFLNPVSYLEAKRHVELFQQFEGIFADGKLMVDAIKILYGKSVIRRSFDMTSLADQLFHYASVNNSSIYVVASTIEEVEKTINEIKDRYPGIIIAGFRSGFFQDSAERENAINKLVGTEPDFLIIGMGAIKQERFLLEAKQQGFRGIGFTCGGFISQTASKGSEMDYYLKWVDKYNLRFLYRMYKEPHTRKRYLKAGILFPIAMIASRLKGGIRQSGGGNIRIAIRVLLPVKNQLRRAA